MWKNVKIMIIGTTPTKNTKIGNAIMIPNSDTAEIKTA